ncbi:MAG: cytochrome c family protein, partial [Planctomycetota bacterium]
VREFFPARKGGQKDVNILIISGRNDAVISSISQTGIVDCIICPAESDQPMVIGGQNRKPLVISVGQFGRYVCELQVKNDGTADRLNLTFRGIPVEEDLPRDASLVSLYKDYQQIVKDRNLLEKYPRFSLPNGLEYVGSKSCRPCHPEYTIWRDTGHAQAYATLEQVGSQFDPECVVCHVVGMEYESGFVSEDQSSHLKNVDCENCHGPASEHIRTLGKAKLTESRSTCTDCHTPEHSGEYAGNERAFLEKIIHWTEPNQPGNVK